MSTLIRKIRVTGTTYLDSIDTEFDRNELTFGASASCDVQLFGSTIAAEHVRLWFGGGKVQFECRGNAVVVVEKDDRRRGSLGIGDTLLVGSNRLSVIKPPAGFAVAIEVVVDKDLELSSRVRHAKELRTPTLPTRALSYALCALVAIVGLIIPVHAYLQSLEGNSGNKLLDRGDIMWSTGPLLHAHQSPVIGGKCTACHREAFSPVANQTCLGCHVNSTGHRDDNRKMPFDDGSCITCHREHSEPETMVIAGNEMCVNCHSASIAMDSENRRHDSARFGDARTAIVAVTGFNEDAHPDFSPSHLHYDEKTGEWFGRRQATRGQRSREQSNLKFPHKLHLDEGVVTTDHATALNCADCHQLKAENEHFEPINMEQHCSQCHELGLDIRFPARRIPHASSETLLVALQEYHITRYARQLKSGSGSASVAPPRHQQFAAWDKCFASGDVLACGEQLADREMRRLFRQSGCVDCHRVTDANKVEPVALTADWYPEARFDHKPHLQLGEVKHERACLACHRADLSDDSGDILIPDRANCLQCHNDWSAQQVSLECKDCHNLHRANMPAMQATQDEGRWNWRNIRRKLGVSL